MADGSNITYTVVEKLVTERCCECGTLFAMMAAVNAERRLDKKLFYCPFGHAQRYTGKPETQLLREQLETERRNRQRAEQNVAMWQDDAKAARSEADHQRARANGYKGHAARITKRAKAGVCPCCNRTFVQLARHMASQHPQFTPDAPERLKAEA